MLDSAHKIIIINIIIIINRSLLSQYKVYTIMSMVL